MVENKRKQVGRVRVCTLDAEAKAGHDYERLDTVLEFKKGEGHQFVNVLINDDDNWEPDKDFFLVLYNADSTEQLTGQDTRTRVTIIDDDKPGHIYFQETKAISALAPDGFAHVVIERRNGSDGVVTVDFTTIELDDSAHTATAGVDFEAVTETVRFQ